MRASDETGVRQRVIDLGPGFITNANVEFRIRRVLLTEGLFGGIAQNA